MATVLTPESPAGPTTAYAAWLGAGRGWIEFRHHVTGARELTFNLVLVAVLLGVTAFQQTMTVDGVPVSALTLVSSLAMVVALSGVTGVGTELASEREDTTLLRTRAVPHGLTGLLTGRLVTTLLDTVFTVALMLGVGRLVLGAAGGQVASSVHPVGLWNAETLLWLIPLGLLATVPLGAILGSVFSQVRLIGANSVLGLLVIGASSGIVYPISRLPEWLQDIGQVFPLYWIGLGLRSAFLPDSARAVEIDGSWRTVETVGVLGAWALAGLLVATVVLRRMARRESGVDLDVRRRKALQRVP